MRERRVGGHEALKEEVVSGYQVLSDGRTCWVNAPTGESVARFSVNGIDIHRLASQQRTLGACLDCKPGPLGEDGWLLFKLSMRQHYSLEVHDRHKPRRLAP